MKKINTGFTLAELMAVVIILAILTALASGSYKKAVERSRISDGVLAASTIMAAVDRKYIEERDAYPTIGSLDISLNQARACTTPSDYCIKTKYFETSIVQDTTSGEIYVEAVRMKETVRGDFAIRAYSGEFGTHRTSQPVCIYYTQTGQDLCISAGYTCDTTTSTCSK